ncbi:hypothetical protein F5148DRAFT_730498 [Russula earlei]|uniref:Uncharacterized protein n=1 Tax=Russula earlei TaxID=71964 RepID=A0ACC0UNQ8_9AGAM|nr:hypothetical protein F5148DRAFT_730498 [Russula earlei]
MPHGAKLLATLPIRVAMFAGLVSHSLKRSARPYDSSRMTRKQLPLSLRLPGDCLGVDKSCIAPMKPGDQVCTDADALSQEGSCHNKVDI